MTLTPQQRTACAELVSRGTGMNCFEEAVLLIDTIETLIETHEVRAVDLIRWLTLLPRVKDRAAALAQAPLPDPRQLALVTPVETLPATMQRAVKPAHGQSKSRPTHWLTDPANGPAVVKRTGRPSVGACGECGAEFPMNPTGRPARYCPEHRWASRRPSRQETA